MRRPVESRFPKKWHNICWCDGGWGYCSNQMISPGTNCQSVVIANICKRPFNFGSGDFVASDRKPQETSAKLLRVCEKSLVLLLLWVHYCFAFWIRTINIWNLDHGVEKSAPSSKPLLQTHSDPNGLLIFPHEGCLLHLFFGITFPSGKSKSLRCAGLKVSGCGPPSVGLWFAPIFPFFQPCLATWARERQPCYSF